MYRSKWNSGSNFLTSVASQFPLSPSPGSLLGLGENQPGLPVTHIHRMEWLWSPRDSFVIFCGHSHVQCKLTLFLLLFSLQLSKLTVPVLKEFVKQAGIKCGTKKADLVEAIKDHFGVWFLCILKNIIDFILKNIFSLLHCCSGQSQATIPAWGWEVVSRLDRESLR